MWPELLAALSEKIHALADCLGEDHDLAVLREILVKAAGGAEVLDGMLAALDARRRELQQAAMKIGERIYTEKPSEFIVRMGNYWKTWRTSQQDA